MIDRFWKGGSKAMTILGWQPPRLSETHSFLRLTITITITKTKIIDAIVIDTIVIDTIVIEFLDLVDLVKDVLILIVDFIMNISM